MESTVLQRFKKSVEYLKETKIAKSQKDIGTSMGVSPSYFSEILHDRIKLTAEHIQIFCTAYNVNPLYIFGVSDSVLLPTPYPTNPKRIDFAHDSDASPLPKSVFVSPKTTKNVSPTVSPTHENCRICDEKERVILQQKETIQVLKEVIHLLREKLHEAIPDQKKSVG